MFEMPPFAVAERVRQTRQRTGLSRRELADAAGLDRSTIGRIERGRQIPRLATLEALAAALRTDPDHLRGA